MAASAPAAQVAAPALRRRPAKPAPARRAARETRVAGGVLWIVLLAVLLSGIVALNVAVLRLNLELDRLGQERAELRARNAELASRISSSASAPRIETLARTRLGLVPAQPGETTYIDLPSP